MNTIFLKSPEDTALFGILLGRLCVPGDVVCLKGDLGAGKTTLTQAIAEGCGVDKNEYVSSPSYALFHQYEGIHTLYHMDFYRLNSSDDVIINGLDEYFYLSGISVIEWYEIAESLLPDNCLFVSLDITAENIRKLSCISNSESWKEKIDTLFRSYSEKLKRNENI